MKISILIDPDFDMKNCCNGYIAALMISEWWLFLKNNEDLKCLAIFQNIEDVRQYIHRHFTAT